MKKNHLKEIARLSLPIMLGSVLQILMGTFDMMFISRLGTKYAQRLNSLQLKGVFYREHMSLLHAINSSKNQSVVFTSS